MGFARAAHQESQIVGQMILAERSCYLQMLGRGVAALETLAAYFGLETLAVDLG